MADIKEILLNYTDLYTFTSDKENEILNGVDDVDLHNYNAYKLIMKRYFGFSNFKNVFQIKAALELVSEPKKTIFMLVPTGSGKSVPYLLATKSEESKTTIIILPSLNLISQIVCQLRRMNCIPLVLSSDISKHVRTNILLEATMSTNNYTNNYDCIVCTPEQFLDKDVSSFVDILYRKKILTRIVVDEAHTPLHCSNNFRRGYSNLYDYLQSFADCQMLLLSATLTMESAMHIRNLLNRNNVTIIRGSIFRPNIKILRIDRSALITPSCEVRDSVIRIKDFNETIMKVSNLKGIVITGKSDDINITLAQYQSNGFHCVKYCSMLNSNEKAKALQEWQTNPNITVLVTCTSNVTGLDPKLCHFIVHRSLPLYTSTYIQEIGRVCRNGAVGLAILYTTSQGNTLFKHNAAKIERMSNSLNITLTGYSQDSECTRLSHDSKKAQFKAQFCAKEIKEMKKLLARYGHMCLNSILVEHNDNIKFKSCINSCLNCIEQYKHLYGNDLEELLSDFNKSGVYKIDINDKNEMDIRSKMIQLLNKWEEDKEKLSHQSQSDENRKRKINVDAVFSKRAKTNVVLNFAPFELNPGKLLNSKVSDEYLEKVKITFTDFDDIASDCIKEHVKQRTTQQYVENKDSIILYDLPLTLKSKFKEIYAMYKSLLFKDGYCIKNAFYNFKNSLHRLEEIPTDKFNFNFLRNIYR